MANNNYKYTKKYDKENTINISLKLNCKTDADIIEYLNALDNKQGTVKKLIRQEISKDTGTNADWLRSLSDDDLEWWLTKLTDDAQLHCENKHVYNWSEWLHKNIG